MQRAAVGLAGKPRIDVTEVFMRRRVVRIQLDRRFERGPGLIELALRRIQRRQVVVGLGQLGKVLREGSKSRCGIRLLALLVQDHAAQKAHLRIAWFVRNIQVGLGKCLGRFALAQQLVDIGIVVCPGWAGTQGHGQQACEDESASPHSGKVTGSSAVQGKGQAGVCHEASWECHAGDSQAGMVPGVLLPQQRGKLTNRHRKRPFILG